MQNTMETGNKVATMQLKVGTFDTFSTVCQSPMYIIVLTTSSSAKKYSVLYVDVLCGNFMYACLYPCAWVDQRYR